MSLFDQLPMALTIIGFLLVFAEAAIPGGGVFVILGVSLLGTGIIATITGVSSPHILAATILALGIATTFLYKNFNIFQPDEGRNNTTDSSELTGQTGRVVKTVSEDSGRVKLKNAGFNPHYEARCESGTIAEGESVVVTDPGGGNVVTVEEA